MATLPTYVLITAARNEAQFIELTLKSMVGQTYRPLKWIVVSDGSTDATDDIVRKYAAENPWIELLRMPERAERHFAGKVYAFNAGYARAKDLDSAVIGNVDADVSFEPEHFQFLLSKFAEDPQLGVGGTPFKQGSWQYDYRYVNIENVWGGCQLFRRECYEAIGGYTPVKAGGIDHIAVVSARMKGWKTRTFTEKMCIHHREMNTAGIGEKSMQGFPLSYVVVTPARNEAQFIELTIKSMLAQTVRPMKWVIVSDGSTDGTDEIVKQYTPYIPWIELVRTPERRERDFAGKVHAFEAGYARMAGLTYDAIVSLDADTSFEGDYFSLLLDKLATDSKLGMVGTPFQEDSGQKYDYRFVSIEHVSGACQVFRRKCFEEIGGYLPLKGGSIDHIAVITARMKGWKTQTFTEKTCFHHRVMGTAGKNLLRARFGLGLKDYLIGNHPIWELFRTARQMSMPPIFVGGLAIGAGYLWALLRQLPRPVPSDLIAFHRREQMQRLNRFVRGNRSVDKINRPHDCAKLVP